MAPPQDETPRNNVERFEFFYGIKEIHKNWGWFLAIGIALILLGTLAIGAAGSVTLASMVLFGILLGIGGIVQIVNAFKMLKGNGFFVNFFSGCIYLIVGALLALNPALGAITLTLLLAIFYTATGLFKIGTALYNRFANWGWLLVSGIVSFILGILIWSEWPFSGLWIIGLFVGIDLILVGWIWVALSLSAKNLPEDRNHP